MNGQVRYNGDVYDIIDSVTLGTHQYLIIGSGSDNKFYDVAFIEKKIEDEKVRYIYPNISYEFHDKLDFFYIQGQTLMDYLVNQIKDGMNTGKLGSRQETVYQVRAEVLKITGNPDIKNFFDVEKHYNNEGQFEESTDILIRYYDPNYKMESKVDSIVEGEKQKDPDFFVDEVYGELEKTQNFGVSGIFGYESKEPVEDIFDSADEISLSDSKGTTDLEVSSSKDEEVVSEILPPIEKTFPNLDQPLSVSDIKFLLETKGDKMTLQQKIYWEGEAARLGGNSSQETVQDNIIRDKVKTLSNGNKKNADNAAYISLSLLLYLIGSFELLLSIIMFAKYL